MGEDVVNLEAYKTIHPRARAGIELYNRGRFFEAHEELEAAWRSEPGPIRGLYIGILQVAVAYLHLERGNFTGARKVFRRSRRNLKAYSGSWQGIDIDQFKADSARIEALAEDSSKRGVFIPPVDWPPQITYM
jgi:predicted metal-dependent hydrolase